jgi:hypothetical protein
MARPTLHNNPKFKLLVRQLGLPRPYVRGLLECMWDSCHESGDTVFKNADLAEAATEWPGDRGQLAEHLVAAGFLDKMEDGGLEVHDYWDHCPSYVKDRRRKEETRRARRRDHPKTVKECPGKSRTISDSPGNSATPAPSPAPAPNEEECRERSANAAPPTETVMEFPIKGKPGTWKLRKEKRDEWHETYGDLLDVDHELARARQWLLDNSKRKKTPGGMLKFLSGWLARQNDKGGRGSVAHRETPREDPDLDAFLSNRRAAS